MKLCVSTSKLGCLVGLLLELPLLSGETSKVEILMIGRFAQDRKTVLNFELRITAF
jgi:hypothetical protein